MFTIEKNVQIPTLYRGRGFTKFPFAKMLIGESFYAENEKSLPNAAHNYGKNHDMKFCSRKEGKGIRIWRIG